MYDYIYNISVENRPARWTGSVATCCSSARQTWIHQDDGWMDDGKMHQNDGKNIERWEKNHEK